MTHELLELQQNALAELTAAENSAAIDEWRVRYLGKKSRLNAVLRGLGSLPIEERKTVGALANQVRTALETALTERNQAVKEAGFSAASTQGAMDITLPGTPPPVGRLHPLTETQRQLSSCPVLFAWNGEEYVFVSDVLGVGGLGYATGPGEYSTPRPWENFLLPQGLLQPRGERFELKISEPMEENAYLDAVRLAVYDLPPGWNMVMDERMGISEPLPTGSALFYRHELSPSAASPASTTAAPARRSSARTSVPSSRLGPVM